MAKTIDKHAPTVWLLVKVPRISDVSTRVDCTAPELRGSIQTNHFGGERAAVRRLSQKEIRALQFVHDNHPTHNRRHRKGPAMITTTPEGAGEFPPLPEPAHRGPDGTGSYFDSFTAAQMHAYAEATVALRAQAAEGDEGTMVNMTPPATARDRWMYNEGRKAERDPRTSGTRAALIEECCTRIKAADDAMADCDYMLDSDDCISVLRGTWTAPLANDCPKAPPEPAEGEQSAAQAAGQRREWEKVQGFAKKIMALMNTKECALSSVSGYAHDAGERAQWIEKIAREALAATPAPAQALPVAGEAPTGLPFGIIDPDYARIFTKARVLAWQYGFAAVMHGSFTRDLDLLLVPWESRAFADAVPRIINMLADDCDLVIQDGSPTEKPHGRMAWTLLLPGFGERRWVDLSVAPFPLAHAAPAGETKGR